jgi:hypothetical protein
MSRPPSGEAATGAVAGPEGAVAAAKPIGRCSRVMSPPSQRPEAVLREQLRAEGVELELHDLGVAPWRVETPASPIRGRVDLHVVEDEVAAHRSALILGDDELGELLRHLRGDRVDLDALGVRAQEAEDEELVRDDLAADRGHLLEDLAHVEGGGQGREQRVQGVAASPSLLVHAVLPAVWLGS